jgi:hypothetical protein
MGIKPHDFYCMLHWEFVAARESHERTMIEGWRQSRLLMHTIVKVMGGSKSVTNDLTKFLPLPFDDEGKKKKSSREQDIENLLIIQRFKEAGYLKPLENG